MAQRTEKSKIIDRRERKGSGDRGNNRNSGGGSSEPEQRVIRDAQGRPVINPETGNPYADLGNPNFKSGSSSQAPQGSSKSLEQIKNELEGKKTNASEVAVSSGVAAKLGIEGQSRPDVQYYAVSQREAQRQSRQSVDYVAKAENEFVGPRLNPEQEAERLEELRKREIRETGTFGQKAVQFAEDVNQFGRDTSRQAVRDLAAPSINPLFNPLDRIEDAGRFGTGIAVAVGGGLSAEALRGVNYLLTPTLGYEYSDIPEGERALREQERGRQAAYNLLITAGSGMDGGVFRSPSRASVSEAQFAKFEKDFDAFLKKEDIKKGDVVTAEKAAKIQAYIERYNREVLLEEPPGSSVVPIGERRVSKNPFTPKPEERAVGVELSLRPVESATILERTKSRGAVTQQDTFLILKKGEPELINPKDIQEFSFVKLEGQQRTRIGPFPNEPSNVEDNIFLRIGNDPRTVKVETFKYTDDPDLGGYYNFVEGRVGLSSTGGKYELAHELSHAADFRSGQKLSKTFYDNLVLTDDERGILQAAYREAGYPDEFIVNEIFADAVALKRTGFKGYGERQSILLDIIGKDRLERNEYVNLGEAFVRRQTSYNPEFALTSEKGKLSTKSTPITEITQDVKELVPAEEFYQSIGLTGAKIERGDFFARIDSLDLPNAKIFKREAVKLNDEVAFGDIYRTKELSVSGFEPANKNTPDPLDLKRITRKYKDAEPKEKVNPLLDGPDEVKLLTVQDAKEIIEYETGFQVKIYTFDDVARTFEEVELYIPKKGVDQSAASGVFGAKVTTASDIIKKNQKSEENVIASPSQGGNGQETVILQQMQEQETESVLEVKEVAIAESSTKSQAKQESSLASARQEFSSVSPDEVFFEPGVGVAYRRGNKIFTPDATGSRVTEIQSNRFIMAPFSQSRTEANQAPGFDMRAGQEPRASIRAGSLSITGPKSTGGQDADSLIKLGQRQSFEAIQVQNQEQSQRSIFRDLYDNIFKQKPEQPKSPIPPVKFDFDKKEKDIFGFTIEVRREGKFEKAGVVGDLSKAVNIAKREAEDSAAASVRIIDSQGNVVEDLSFGDAFYKSKSERGVFIEKNKNRINTAGEKREITDKGIFANLNKPRKGILSRVFDGGLI